MSLRGPLHAALFFCRAKAQYTPDQNKLPKKFHFVDPPFVDRHSKNHIHSTPGAEIKLRFIAILSVIAAPGKSAPCGTDFAVRPVAYKKL